MLLWGKMTAADVRRSWSTQRTREKKKKKQRRKKEKKK